MIKKFLLSITLGVTVLTGFSGNNNKKPIKSNASENLTTPLVWYQFNDLSDIGKDSCGHFDLELYGNPDNLRKDTDGKGVRHGAATLYAPSIRDAKDFSDYFENFTFSFYFKPTEEARTSRLMGNGIYQLSSGSAIYYSNDNNGYNLIPDIGTTDGYINGSPNGHFEHFIPVGDINSWHHFAASVDTKNSKIIYFYDGEQAGSTINAKADFSNIQQTFSLLGITHTAGGGATEFYNGFMDDFRIYDFALSVEEMKKIERGTLTNLGTQGETIVSVETDNNVSDVNGLLEGEFVYDKLPKKATLTGSEGTILDSDINYYNYERVGDDGTAFGMLMDHTMKNTKGFGVLVRFKFDNNAELPLIMSPAFTENMMLQRHGSRVYGRAGNTTVTVKYGNYPAVSTECHNGEWEVNLDLEETTNPQNLVITTSSGESKVITNVIVGEVWYCSGQSNMDWNVFQTSGETLAALKAADYSNIRLMKRTMNSNKVKPVEVYSDRWIAPTQYNDVQTYTAIGTSYALHLAAELKAKEGKTVPVGIIQAAIGGSGIEQWLSKETIEVTGSRIDNNSGKFDSEYYNGMSWSVRNYSIRGVVWYQGEDNVYAPEMYKKQLKGYVSEMKKLFNNDELTFICAQLPMYNMIEWADFRQMQWEVSQEIPELYMVTGIDLGEYNDIHPQKDKFLFAGRMCGVAMKYVYGDETASGLSPYPKKIYHENNKIRIIYGEEGIGLTPRFNSSIDGFEVQVSGRWEKVRAEILNDEIILSDFNGVPSKVRYFYLANTIEYDEFGGFNYVYNSHDLPLAPFILGINPKTFTVNFESAHGSLSNDTSLVVESGTTLNVNVSPDAGYEIESVTQNGQEIYFSGNSFTTSMIMKDTEIIINYRKLIEAKIYNITVISDSTKGGYRLSSEQVQDGGIVSLIISPKENYIVDKVTVNGNIANVDENIVVLTKVGTNLIIVITYKDAISTNSKNGCSGSVMASSLLISVVSSLGLVFILEKGKNKKRKEIL